MTAATLKAVLWFVMLRSMDNLPMLLVDDDDQPALFNDEHEAAKAAVRNPFGQAYGWEVFPWEK